jgi:hypothetical protein
VDDCFTARPKGATQMHQYGVAVLEKDSSLSNLADRSEGKPI